MILPETSLVQDTAQTNVIDDNKPTPSVPTACGGHEMTRSPPKPATSSSYMSASEIVTYLSYHGYQNLTDRLETPCNYISTDCFGHRYRGRLNDGTSVAIRTVRLEMDFSKSDQSWKPSKRAVQMLHKWSKCRHPNVVELLGLVPCPHWWGISKDRIGMVSVWVDNGNLPSYLAQHHDTDRCQMSIQISEGLAYLHSMKIIHGDLKGVNVLVSSQGMPMLANFGIAGLQPRTPHRHDDPEIYSIRWTAPEVLQGDINRGPGDIYALGMTILETITGKVPYPETSFRALFQARLKEELPERPEDCIPPDSQHGDTLWAMLTKCWTCEPENRPLAAEVVSMMRTITQEGLMLTSGGTSSQGYNQPPVEHEEQEAEVASGDFIQLMPPSAPETAGTMTSDDSHTSTPRIAATDDNSHSHQQDPPPPLPENSGSSFEHEKQNDVSSMSAPEKNAASHLEQSDLPGYDHRPGRAAKFAVPDFIRRMISLLRRTVTGGTNGPLYNAHAPSTFSPNTGSEKHHPYTLQQDSLASLSEHGDSSISEGAESPLKSGIALDQPPPYTREIEVAIPSPPGGVAAVSIDMASPPKPKASPGRFRRAIRVIAKLTGKRA